jgi:hypothetical protein
MQTTQISPSIEMQRERINNISLSDTDKENYFKSILSDKPYEETVDLFDGKMRATFRVMTVQENSDVVNQIELDRKAERTSDNDSYMITIAAYRLCLSMVNVDNQPFSNITKENYKPADENDSYVLARAKVTHNWATAKLSLFLDAFQKFEAKIIRLTNEVQTPNFWIAST